MPKIRLDNTKYLTLLFYSFAVLFPVFITAGQILQLPKILFFIITGGLYLYVIGKTYINQRINVRTSIYPILFYVIIFALINITYALDRGDAQAKWLIWIVSLFTFMRLTSKIDYDNFKALLKHIPWILLLNTTLSVILTIDDYGETTSRNNAIGLYAGALFISSFYIKGWKRLFIMMMALVFIYGSSSRAALLGTALAAIPFLFYSMRLKRFYLFLLPVFLAIIYFSPQIDNAVNEFFTRKAFGGNAYQNLLESQNQRTILFKTGVDLISKRPWTGYGLGDGYTDLVNIGDYESKTVHNGYLTTLIEVGVPIGIFIIIILLIAFLNAMRDKYIGMDMKMANFSFFFYIFIRANSENYLIFNSANSVSIIFFTLSLIYLFKPKMSTIE